MEYLWEDGNIIVATHKVEGSILARSTAEKDSIVTYLQDAHGIESPTVETVTAPTTDEQNVIDAIDGKVCCKKAAQALLDKFVPLAQVPTDTDILMANQDMPL